MSAIVQCISLGLALVFLLFMIGSPFASELASLIISRSQACVFDLNYTCLRRLHACFIETCAFLCEILAACLQAAATGGRESIVGDICTLEHLLPAPSPVAPTHGVKAAARGREAALAAGETVAVPTVMLEVVGHSSSADYTYYVVKVTINGTEVHHTYTQ